MQQIKFLQNIEALNSLDSFDLVYDENKLVKKFEKQIDKNSNNKVITTIDQMQDFIDMDVHLYVIKDKPTIFETKPIFPISIPKSGTHLLFELLDAFGYQKGEVLPSNPKPSHWYYLQNSNSHTECKRFFIDKVYEEAFGFRDNFFVTSPAIFIYRHPLDILVSEANYYYKKGKTAFYGYFDGLDFDERVSLLINDRWLLGSIEQRVANFACWLRFPNVISISFEEIVGAIGGGDDETQLKAIWAIMLKLQIEGSPKEIAQKIYNPKSDTFNKGQIGNFQTELTGEHLKQFAALDQEFMHLFGYDTKKIFSQKIDFFRNKKLHIDQIEHPDYLKEIFFFDFNIVKEKSLYVGYKYRQNFTLSDETLEGLKLKILHYWIKEIKC